MTKKLLLSAVAGIGFMLAATVTQAQERLPQFLKHTVKQGENVNTITQKYGIKQQDFCLINDFPNDVKLSTGQVVLIRKLKDGEQAPAEEAAPVTRKVVVKADAEPGETTTRSTSATAPAPEKTETKTTPARTTSTTNSETTTASAAPATSRPVASTKTVEVAPNGTEYKVTQSEYHIVEKGQTFYRVALIYGLTVDELKALNNLSNTTIAVGQKLRVRK